MLDHHIVLENSRDGGAYLRLCSRCGCNRSKTDGVEMGQDKWLCGKCWRGKATRPTGAVAALAAEKRRQA